MTKTITISENGDASVQYDNGLSVSDADFTPAALNIFNYAKTILNRSSYLSMHIEISAYEEYCHVKTFDGETLEFPINKIIENDKIAVLFDEEMSVNSHSRNLPDGE